MKALNVAMIGAGRMGQTHAKVLSSLLDVRIAAVVDNISENAQVVASVFNAKVLTLEEVFNDSGIEAVIITTPTPTHAELVMQAAQAGKAIFVEKPVADSLAAAEAVVRTVQETGVPCQVGFQRRYDPAYIEVKRRLESAELGKLENFRAISRDPFAPKLEFLKTSGGIMVDLGIHDLDTARFFFGEVEEVYCIGGAVRDESLREFGLFDLAVATLRFCSGALGTFEGALNTAYGYEIVADIIGEKGKYHLEKKQQLNLQFWGEQGVIHDYPQHFDQRFPEAYAAEIIAFAKNIQAGRPVSPTAADATESLRLALAAQQSLETGKVVNVQTFGKEVTL